MRRSRPKRPAHSATPPSTGDADAQSPESGDQSEKRPAASSAAERRPNGDGPAQGRPDATPSTVAPTNPTRRTTRRTTWIAAGAAIVLLTVGSLVFADWWSSVPESHRATYVGRDRCIQCHADQNRLWTGSHHDLAMDKATPETVLGDFDDATLEHHGVTSRMFRRGSRYFVQTEGPDGKAAEFEVKYVLGVTPLQQYMVEFDRSPDQPEHELARLQVLRVSWDTVAGRWFHLDPPDVAEKLDPDDGLHWTGIFQRWNTMCADCHSTNLQRNFDPKSLTYHTTFSEIDVSCEACHGPGSLHVELALSRSLFWDRKRGYGLVALKGPSNEPQIQACAPCHSRRSVLTTDYRHGDPFFDSFHTELLGEQTYHADGQILDEVYEFGSFTQSKMYHKNIRCSDCHDPHSLTVKYPDNRLCTSCHAHSPGKYDGPAHHHHDPAKSGARCVDCHMPITKYMAVDPRRDHSLRIPRPGLSVDLGTPNACTRCHLEIDNSLAKIPEADREPLTQYADWLRLRSSNDAVRSEIERLDRWSYAAARKWWGEKADAKDHYAYAFHAAQTEQPDAEQRLIKVAQDNRLPVIVRATAAERLARYPSSATLRVAEQMLRQDEPQLQIAALARIDAELAQLQSRAESVGSANEAARLYRGVARAVLPLLDAPRRAVRYQAATLLIRVPWLGEILSGPERDRLEALVDEYVAAQSVNSDRAGTHVGIALIHEARGDYPKAVAEYETAIAVEPRLTGPRTNLATLYENLLEPARRRREAEQRSGDQAAVATLDAEIDRLQAAAKRLRSEELPLIERDARLLPDNVDLQYRLAMSLYLNGRASDAETTLRRVVQLAPRHDPSWLALTLLLQQQRRYADALQCVDRLIELRPGDPSVEQLRADLRQQLATPR